MAKSRTPSGGTPPKDNIVDVDVTTEMEGSFLEYAYSVIYSRALPDARDGLKPVQRRILYQMAEMGLRPDRGHVKSARVVGEVMGRLHPHGDSAIYDAVVRMAQPFSLRLPMVDGHGNFGSLDDGPAAMRYCLAGDTRVRLANGASPRIEDLVGLDGPGDAAIDVMVLDRDGKPAPASVGFHSGEHPTFTVTTATGLSITGTANHPLLCLVTPAGVPMLAWLRIDEIAAGTVVCLSRETIAGHLPTPREWKLGVLCGAWASEGWASPTRAGFNNTDEEFFSHVLDAYDEIVGGPRYVATRRTRRSGRTIHELDIQNTDALCASPLREFIGSRSADKSVPEVVWAGGVGIKRAFLMAAFEGDGSVNTARGNSATIHYSTRSPVLCHQVQELLLEFGVATTRYFHAQRGEYKVIVSGHRNLAVFGANVGFLTRKQMTLRRHLGTTPATTHRLSRDFVPYVRTYLEETLAPERGSGRSWLLNHNVDRTERWQTDRSLILNRIKDPEMARIIMNVMDPGYRYSEVVSVAPAGQQPVYSIRMDTEDHSFLAGGFVNHNTECRLAPPALAMTASLDEDVVGFEGNYDGRETEPVVLPAAIPNLLVNGASGIAVGMATNMAPHNLGEVVSAARHLLAHPQATLDRLIRFVPGPDLPTGGVIVGLEGIRQAYQTGKGSFRMRATTRIEQVSARRQGIVVTSLPYGVGPERVIERIRELVLAKKLSGIANLIDLTDADHGLRVVIEVKSGFNASAVLTQLHRMTPMEEQFSINNVALVNGRPQTLGLKELLQVYLDHRLEVVTRRSEFRRTKATDRLHLVDGMLIAIVDIDEVIAIIRGSDDTAQARHRLISAFELTETQVNYILEMPLRRLTKFSRIELETEADELRQQIDALTRILDDPEELRSVVSAELAEAAAAHGDARRTILLESDGAEQLDAAPLEVPDGPCRVLLSNTGLLARTQSDELPDADGPRKKHDAVVAVVPATTRGSVGVVTSDGHVRRVSVLDLPALPPTSGAPALSGGTPLGALLDLPKAVTVVGLVPFDDTVAIGTRNGVVKRVAAEDVPSKNEWELIRLTDDDRVVGVAAAPGDGGHLTFITEHAQLLRFPADSVRPQGRAAGGMAGIKLASGDHVLFFGVLDPGRDGLVVTAAGSDDALPGTTPGACKVTEAGRYPSKGRATGGVRCHRFRSGEDRLLFAWAGAAPARAASASGVPIELPATDTKRDGAGAALDTPIAGVGSPVG